MKKFILFLIFIPIISSSQDVRDCYWGMTTENVINIEGRYPDKIDKIFNETELTYDKLIMFGKNITIVYFFEDDRLVSATTRVYWSNNKNKSRLNRLINFKEILNYYFYKGFAINQNWVVGNYYSSIFTTDRNRIYKSELKFPIRNNSNFNIIASNINLQKINRIGTNNHNDYCDYGITLHNINTNIFIMFPIAGKIYKYSNQRCDVESIIGWIKYSPHDCQPPITRCKHE